MCVGRIQRIAAAIIRAQDAVAKARGLFAGDLYTLYLLERLRDHAARPSDLAKALTMTTGAMTKRLDRLQAAGLVRRESNPNDRRGVLIRLTDEGLAAAAQARDDNRAHWRGPIGPALTDAEWTAFADQLQRIEAIVSGPADTDGG